MVGQNLSSLVEIELVIPAVTSLLDINISEALVLFQFANHMVNEINTRPTNVKMIGFDSYESKVS
jgi:hypothetical protein